MNSLLSEITTVSIDLIEPHPENPRIGDIEAIKKSLTANKQFQPILVQESTGFIVAGNHTYKAAVDLGWTEVDVAYIDVDDAKAKAIMLAANKTADLGSYDERLLAQLISDITFEEEALLEGTGYSSEEIDDLLAASMVDIPLDEPGEGVESAAAILDRIMPGSDEDYDDIDDESDDLIDSVEGASTPAPITNTVGETAVEFVIFRFGELRAKVPRPTYERFIKGFLKEHSNDLALAGIAAAIRLGIDSEKVEPAVAQGSERWL